MVYEFEGKTEKEAMDLAIGELGLERDQFDVEILETQKSGFLNLQKKVVIRVHTHDDSSGDQRDQSVPQRKRASSRYNPNPEPENDFEHALVDFVRSMVEKMGYEVEVSILYREDDKIALKLDSEHSGILIGRKGKNLDALQLLANVIATRLSDENVKVIVDAENYRSRREEALIRLAQKVGDQVLRTKKSKLLEPMNPFERRLIHTTLNDIENIETVSEGEGLIKQVRVVYKGYR
ncbi:RNA-binding cell elongation regulator Jag/EloR [Salinispira pacifica]|uniref:RNA-binding protein KhpB n=1 Tax=Salinispira pacifica TaxID=1307761 RepID=V5WD09_9SPIO|nr:RNA-binding cell elongation regulator Jag/EloR [Salinispira pacifica]AHC13454.1 RNA-binding protein Jag [Salinispira pacifica]